MKYLLFTSLFFLSLFAQDQSQDQFCKHFNAWFVDYKSKPKDTSRISVNVDGDTRVEVINYTYIPKANGSESSVFGLEASSGAEQKPYFQSGLLPKHVFHSNCKACRPMSETALSHFEQTLKIAERFKRIQDLQSQLDRATWYKITAKDQDAMVDEQLLLLKEIDELKKNL